MLFCFLVAFETDPTIAECVRSDGKMKNAVGADNQDSNYQSDNGTTLFTHSIVSRSRGFLHRLVRSLGSKPTDSAPTRSTKPDMKVKR